MSNYPEGVTGNEYDIAGPSADFSETREVQCGRDECDAFETLVEVEGDTRVYGDTFYFSWTCPTCSTPGEDEYDADYHVEYEPEDYL